MLFQLPLYPLSRAPVVPEQLDLGRALTTIRAASSDRIHLLWGSAQGIAMCFAERMLVLELRTESGRRRLESASWHQSGKRTKAFDFEAMGPSAADNLGPMLSSFVANREPDNPRGIREITYSRETLLWTVRENERFVDFTFGVVCARGEYRPGKVTAPILDDPAYRSLELAPEHRVLRLTDPATITL